MTAKARSLLKGLLAAGAYLTLLYVGIGWAGKAQQGNFLAFVGSLVMALPAARQMNANRPFHEAASREPTDPTLIRIQSQISATQVVSYVRFSWFDAVAYAVGALSLAVGFLVQVLNWTFPV